MEGINNRLKLILRQAYGFMNFDNFRARLLACFSDYSIFRSNEVQLSKSSFISKKDRNESILARLTSENH